MSRLAVAFGAFFFAQSALAIEYTGTGRILYTQGHITPSCRTVVFKDNATGSQSVFRIAATTGAPDDISAVVLAALVSQLNVTIAYEPGQTTGCGGELRIIYVTIAAQ